MRGVLVLPLLAGMVFFHAVSAQARGNYAPEKFVQAFQETLHARDKMIEQLVAEMGRLPEMHGTFVTKTFVETPFAWHAMRNKLQRLDGYLEITDLPSIQVDEGWERKIGAVPLGFQAYDPQMTRRVAVDIRSPSNMLVSTYGRKVAFYYFDNKRKAKAPKTLKALWTDRYEKFRTALVGVDGSFDNPERHPLWQAFGLSRNVYADANRALLAYWKSFDAMDRQSRRRIKDAIDAIDPPMIALTGRGSLPVCDVSATANRESRERQVQESGGFSTFKASSKPAKGGFLATDSVESMTSLESVKLWYGACRNRDAVRYRFPYGKDIAEMINEKTFTNFIVVEVSALKFRIKGSGKLRRKYITTFENILETMVRKGRAVRIEDEHLSDWGVSDGWSVYADAKGAVRGAVLFNAQEGIGIWQPALFRAVDALVPKVRKINELSAEMYRTMMKFQEHALRNVARKFRTAEAIDEAF